MKTHHIKQGVSARQSRSDRSYPDLGQVTRMRDAKAPVDKVLSYRRSRTANSNGKRSSLFISLLLGLGTLAVITVAIFLWLKPILNRKEKSSPAAVPLKTNISSQFQSPSREQALELVKRALYVNDMEGVKSFFRLGQTAPAEILAYLQALEKRDGDIERFEWLSSMDKDGLLIEGVLVILKGKEKPVERLALLTPDSGGSWKIDFEAFARSMNPSWESLLEKREDRAVVRVLVGSDVYYNGPFRDEAEWVCYAMVSPDFHEVMRGYCKVGSPEAEKLGRLFLDGATSSRATLEIRTVKDAESRQFEIVRLVASDWIVAAGMEQSD